MFTDRGDYVVQSRRQIKFTARPITGQILRPAIDRAIFFNDAGAPDPDKGRKL
jgi:hypothetical protein